MPPNHPPCPSCGWPYAHAPGCQLAAQPVVNLAEVIELEEQQKRLQQAKARGASLMTWVALAILALVSHSCAGCVGVLIGRSLR